MKGKHAFQPNSKFFKAVVSVESNRAKMYGHSKQGRIPAIRRSLKTEIALDGHQVNTFLNSIKGTKASLIKNLS